MYSSQNLLEIDFRLLNKLKPESRPRTLSSLARGYGRGRDDWLSSVLLLILTKDVEQRAVPVHRSWRHDGRNAVPIVHIALGRGNSLEDRRRRCWPDHKIRTAVQMAAHNQDPFAAIGVSDSHKQEAGPIVTQVACRAGNVVDEPSGIKPRRNVEANQLLYAIGTITGYS